MGGLKDYLKQTRSNNSINDTQISLPKSQASLTPSLLNTSNTENKGIAEEKNHKKENMKIETAASPQSASLSSSPISTASKNIKEYDIYENLSAEFKSKIDETAKLLLELDSTGGWQLISHQNNIEITKKEVGPSMSCARGVGKINAPPIAIVNFIKDFDRRGEWDLMLDSSNSKVIQQYNEQTALFRITFKRVIPTSSRDFCTWNSKWLIIAKSVVDSRCPEQKGFVRADLVVGGYIITPSLENPNISIVTYITQANLNGYIPQSIVKIAMVNQPLCIDGIRKIIEKEVDKYNIIPPHIDVQNSQQQQQQLELQEQEVPVVVNQPEERLEEVEINKSQHQQHTEEITSRTSDEVPTTSTNDTTISTSLQDNTNEQLLKNLGTLVSSCKVLHTDNKLWKTISVKDDVIIQRGHNTSTFRGIGEINASPETIKNLVFDVENSLQYDPLLKSAVVVETINSCSKIVHLIYQTRMCLVTTARDFVVLYHWEETEKNTFVVVAQSVKHSKVPDTPNCIRGEVLTAGFLIKPKDEANTSIVSYISSTDLKNLPATVMSIVQEKQPLVIAAVRQNLTGSKKAQ